MPLNLLLLNYITFFAITILFCYILFYLFLKVFDVLAINGESVVREPFSSRLQRLCGDLDAKIDAYMSSPDRLASDLLVMRKTYFQKKDFSKLLANVRVEKGEHVYFSEQPSSVPPTASTAGAGGKRPSKARDSNSNSKAGPQGTLPLHHKSEGVILQPDDVYKFGGDESLLTWKWPDLRSVDLQVSKRRETPRRDVNKV